MKEHGISDEEAMQALLNIPKLISMNLDKQMKEIIFLFNLYHRFTTEEVMHIFKKFPYLFCCDQEKVQRYMAEFRKYKFTKD